MMEKNMSFENTSEAVENAEKERLLIHQELGNIMEAAGMAKSKNWEEQVEHIINKIGDDSDVKSRDKAGGAMGVGTLLELARIFANTGRIDDARKVYGIYSSKFYGS